MFCVLLLDPKQAWHLLELPLRTESGVFTHELSDAGARL